MRRPRHLAVTLGLIPLVLGTGCDPLQPIRHDLEQVRRHITATQTLVENTSTKLEELQGQLKSATTLAADNAADAPKQIQQRVADVLAENEKQKNSLRLYVKRSKSLLICLGDHAETWATCV